MTQKTQALAQAAMKLGQAMYEPQQGETEPAGGADAGSVSRPAEEEVVDAEFSEVDDENKG